MEQQKTKTITFKPAEATAPIQTNARPSAAKPQLVSIFAPLKLLVSLGLCHQFTGQVKERNEADPGGATQKDRRDADNLNRLEGGLLLGECKTIKLKHCSKVKRPQRACTFEHSQAALVVSWQQKNCLRLHDLCLKEEDTRQKFSTSSIFATPAHAEDSTTGLTFKHVRSLFDGQTST